jgi:heat-inducible transcriptional repressor
VSIVFLDDRKKTILKAIIDDYINTAEPIGSRTIARKHELGLSPATIRLEMADLEDLGFLIQPHTSAGRVPSDKGYRFYVDQLLDIDELTWDQMQKIKEGLEQKIHEVEQLVRTAACVLSKATNYTSMATSPFVHAITVKAVQLVWLEEKKLLVVLVVNGNIIKNAMIKLSDSMSKEVANLFSNYINERLQGIPLHHVASVIQTMEPLDLNPRLLKDVLDGLFQCFSQIDIIDYFLDGTRNILNYPEFKDLEKAKLFLEMMDKKDAVGTMLKTHPSKNAMNIQIGHENELLEAKDCSVIITNYSFGDSIIGSIGIIGPTRMEYAKVIKYLNHIRKKINEEMSKLVKDK